MAKAAKKVESPENKKMVEVEGDKLTVDMSDEEFRKPGKLKKGKLAENGVDVIYEDDDEEEVTPDPEPVTSKKDKKADKAEKSGKVTKVSDSKGSVEVSDDTIKLKPSQRPVPPAHERKTVELRKDYKGGIVTINNLIEEYGMDGKKIRRIIRALGYKAPSTGETGFGAKARYEFEEDSKILAKIRKALDEETEG